jgi:hypothetical protein
LDLSFENRLHGRPRKACVLDAERYFANREFAHCPHEPSVLRNVLPDGLQNRCDRTVPNEGLTGRIMPRIMHASATSWRGVEVLVVVPPNLA